MKPQVTLFDVAAVSKTGFRVDPEDDFDVMGDIFYVSSFPINPYEHAEKQTQISPANDVPAKHPPVVKICGRPINIVTETASFDIDANQWIGFHNQKVLFPWSGTIHEGWMNKPVPNPNSPKFVNVTGILAGVQTVGKLKRFHVDIVGVTFLGAVPAGPSSQSKSTHLKGISTLRLTICSVNPNTQGEAKGGNIL